MRSGLLVFAFNHIVLTLLCLSFAFFFSSRRRHTRYIGDWSSDVCSSDLDATDEQIEFPILYAISRDGVAKKNLADNSTSLKPLFDQIIETIPAPRELRNRSEERRVGKECRSWWRPGRLKEKGESLGQRNA